MYVNFPAASSTASCPVCPHAVQTDTLPFLRLLHTYDVVSVCIHDARPASLSAHTQNLQKCWAAPPPPGFASPAGRCSSNTRFGTVWHASPENNHVVGVVLAQERL